MRKKKRNEINIYVYIHVYLYIYTYINIYIYICAILENKLEMANEIERKLRDRVCYSGLSIYLCFYPKICLLLTSFSRIAHM